MKNVKSIGVLVLVLMVLVAVMGGKGVEGQLVPQMPGPPNVPTPIPACMSTFFGALVQLIPCRAAVAPFSPLPPSEACCNSVKALGQPCLCVLVNGPPISGVDRNMALLLPDKCTANFDPCQTI